MLIKLTLLLLAVLVRGIVHDFEDDDSSGLLLATLRLVNQGGYCTDHGPVWLLPNIQAIFDVNSAAEFFFGGNLIGMGSWEGTEAPYSYFSTFNWNGGCATSKFNQWFEVQCDCNAVSRSDDYDSGLANVICTHSGWGDSSVCTGQYTWVVTSRHVAGKDDDASKDDDAGEDDAAEEADNTYAEDDDAAAENGGEDDAKEDTVGVDDPNDDAVGEGSSKVT